MPVVPAAVKNDDNVPKPGDVRIDLPPVNGLAWAATPHDTNFVGMTRAAVRGRLSSGLTSPRPFTPRPQPK